MSDDPNTPGGNTEPGGGGGGDNPPAGNPGGQGNQGFTQDDLNRTAGNARRAGREAAIKDLLGELGLEKLGDLKAAYQSYREAEDQRKSELEKANEKATNLENEKAKLLAQLNAERVEREVERVALALGANPERLAAVTRLREPSLDGEVDSEGKLNTEAIKQSVESVLSAYPEFKKGQANVGDGSNPGGGSNDPSRALDVSTMSAEEFAELQRRVMAGERVEIK